MDSVAPPPAPPEARLPPPDFLLDFFEELSPVLALLTALAFSVRTRRRRRFVVRFPFSLSVDSFPDPRLPEPFRDRPPGDVPERPAPEDLRPVRPRAVRPRVEFGLGLGKVTDNA